MKKLTKTQVKAIGTVIALYGEETCVKAYQYEKDGNGQSTISIYTGIDFRRVPSATLAGEWILFHFGVRKESVKN